MRGIKFGPAVRRELIRAITSRITDELEEGNIDIGDIATKIVDVNVTNVLGLACPPPDIHVSVKEPT